ncbi:MAG: hypothetical protein Q9174_000704 [Haloplaca sp. 1 TL-2023]
MANLRMAKKELRRFIKGEVAKISEQSVLSQSITHLADRGGIRVAKAAQETLMSLPEYKSARSISVYLSMPRGELSTSMIVADALREGKEVYVPYIYRLAASASTSRSSVMDMVSLHSLEDFKSLEADAWGIPTPNEASLASRKRCLGEPISQDESAMSTGDSFCRLDLMVMPGMAFDRKLARLGHGKGYYDFFLARYQRKGEGMRAVQSDMPFLVGLALEQQILSGDKEVPADTTDWRLDALVAGDGSLRRQQS